MSKPVCITADSTCDLTQELLERFQVKTIPLHVLLGEESYLDGVDFTQEMIFQRYAKDKVLPRTAAISPQEFTDFFTPLVEAGYQLCAGHPGIYVEGRPLHRRDRFRSQPAEPEALHRDAEGQAGSVQKVPGQHREGV